VVECDCPSTKDQLACSKARTLAWAKSLSRAVRSRSNVREKLAVKNGRSEAKRFPAIFLPCREGVSQKF